MDGPTTDRWRLALIGAIGGALVWALVEASDAALIPDRLEVVLLSLVGTAVTAALVMAGPIGLTRAMPRALALAVVTAAFAWLGGLRHEEGIIGSALSVLAALTVASLPVPFLIVQTRSDFRDYPALFIEAWSILVRLVAASAFTGIVWAVIFLSDQVLQIVGLTIIADLLEYWLVSAVISGAVFGFGMAVIHEQADLLSPYPVLRLFRLLLPVVLAVMVVFLIALPFRGLSGLVNGLSPALLLLTMVGAGVSLVSIAVDQRDADVPQSPTLTRAAQGMALVLPIMAGLAGWALWLRVDQHGWTPERLFVALICGLGLGYGLTYAVATLRGAGWMGRIRRANIGMALLVILLAALWLTPLLNAERISARDQLARYDAGRTPLADLDLAALGRWGYPGQAVLDVLSERAKDPGETALAAWLSGEAEPDGMQREAVAKALSSLMPVQPAGANGTRDLLIAAAEDHQLADWTEKCAGIYISGRPGCLMVVADLLPARPGEEAILLLMRTDTYFDLLGLYLDDSGRLATRPVQRADGRLLTMDDMVTLVDNWTAAPPPLTATGINQLGTGESGLLFLP
jgi:Domain of unknown function (DUF4153)